MYDSSSLLAVIPARGGSKGLRRKNVLKCGGKPLIEWTIAAAKAVPWLDAVLVSTDCKEIVAIAQTCGATVPFLRPDHLSTDEAQANDVVRHAWEQYRAPSGRPFDYVVMLQPTSPLRTAAHIEAAIHHYFSHRATTTDTLASVYEVSPKHGWVMQTSHDGTYIRFCNDTALQDSRRQTLSRFFIPNGAIYIARGEALMRGFYTTHTLPYIMSPEDSVDIDGIEDLVLANNILTKK